MSTRSILCLPILVLLFCSADVWAQQLKFCNGDTISGEKVRIDTQNVVWKSPILGSLTIAKSHICQIDGESLIPKPEPPVKRVAFKGKLSLGVEKDEGSSDSEEYDLDLSSSLTRGRYVHRFKGEYEIETKGSRTTEEDYELEYQAERYFKTTEKGWYLYTLATWNKDRFREPEDWRALGLGAGYQWRPGKHTRIKYQMGLDRWSTSESVSGRRSANAGRAVLDLRYKVAWLGELVVFHESEIMWDLSGGARRIDTTTGLRLPLTKQMSIQLSADHDRFDVEDNSDLQDRFDDKETEWKLKVGYAW